MRCRRGSSCGQPTRFHDLLPELKRRMHRPVAAAVEGDAMELTRKARTNEASVDSRDLDVALFVHIAPPEFPNLVAPGHSSACWSLEQPRPQASHPMLPFSPIGTYSPGTE